MRTSSKTKTPRSRERSRQRLQNDRFSTGRTHPRQGAVSGISRSRPSAISFRDEPCPCQQVAADRSAGSSSDRLAGLLHGLARNDSGSAHGVESL